MGKEMTTDKRCQQRLGKQSDTWFSSMNEVETQDCGWRANLSADLQKATGICMEQNPLREKAWSGAGIQRTVERLYNLDSQITSLTPQSRAALFSQPHRRSEVCSGECVGDSNVDAEKTKQRRESGKKLLQMLVWLSR